MHSISLNFCATDSSDLNFWPKAIVILDVPSIAHIPALVASFRGSEFYQKFWSEDPTIFETTEREYNLRVAYSMCGPGVLEDERYKAFMRGFGPLAHVCKL